MKGILVESWKLNVFKQSFEFIFTYKRKTTLFDTVKKLGSSKILTY